MRCGDGKIRETRYGKGDGLCECGGREDRDHVLLECVRWEKERKILWTEWERKEKKGEKMNMKGLMFEEEGIEVVRKFGCETGWIEERRGERREWSKERKEVWGKMWVEVRKSLVRERGREKRERDLRLGRERMRRRGEILKIKGEEGKSKGRAGSPIASVPTLGVYPGMVLED